MLTRTINRCQLLKFWTKVLCLKFSTLRESIIASNILVNIRILLGIFTNGISVITVWMKNVFLFPQLAITHPQKIIQFQSKNNEKILQDDTISSLAVVSAKCKFAHNYAQGSQAISSVLRLLWSYKKAPHSMSFIIIGILSIDIIHNRRGPVTSFKKIGLGFQTTNSFHPEV